MKNRYYRLGIAPLTPILSGLVFSDKKEAAASAREHNRIGEYRGRGVKVYPCDMDGNVDWSKTK